MKISLPLTRALHASSLTSLREVYRRDFEVREGQRPLQVEGQVDQYDNTHRPPINVTAGLWNFDVTFSFTLGTPPQQFIGALDFSRQDLFLPSHFRASEDLPPFHLYNSSLSHTHHPNGTRSSTHLFGKNLPGFWSGDNLEIGGLVVEGMMFQETEGMETWCRGCINDSEFDTWFPLGPYNSSSARNHLSPLAQLVERGILDENVFSMRLARNRGEGEGQLVLGGVIHEDWYEGDFTTIPTTELPIPEGELNLSLNGQVWKVAASSLTLNTSPPSKYTFPPPTIAILNPSFPMMLVSPAIFDELNVLLDAETWGPFAWVACDKRASAPNITLVLAGKEFEVTPWDYIFEQEDEKEPGVVTCMSGVWPHPNDGSWEGVVMLGSAFSKAWVTVWDLEEDGGISFARAKHGAPRE